MFLTLCSKLWVLKDNLKQDARGVSALEYAILIALVVGAGIALFTSGAFTSIFEAATESLDEVNTAVTGGGGGGTPSP